MCDICTACQTALLQSVFGFIAHVYTDAFCFNVFAARVSQQAPNQINYVRFLRAVRATAAEEGQAEPSMTLTWCGSGPATWCSSSGPIKILACCGTLIKTRMSELGNSQPLGCNGFDGLLVFHMLPLNVLIELQQSSIVTSCTCAQAALMC